MTLCQSVNQFGVLITEKQTRANEVKLLLEGRSTHHSYKGSLTRNDFYDTIWMALSWFWYDSTNLNV